MQEAYHEEAQVTTEPTVTTPLAEPSKSSWVKDFSIPISIMIAGAFIGTGIYFSGTDKTTPTPTPADNSPKSLVAKAGVDEKEFQACFESGRTQPLVQDDLSNAVATGGQGTPWSILISADGRKYPINGALGQATVEQLIAAVRSGGNVQMPEFDAAALENITPPNESDHIKGSLDASIIIVEYSDFDCPFCSRFHQTMNNIVDKSNGEVAWIYRHFPIESLHPNAPAVAVASECVAELGGNEAFWKFADGYLAL